MTSTPSTSLTTSQESMPKRSEPKWVDDFYDNIGAGDYEYKNGGGIKWFKIEKFIHTLLAHSQEQARDKCALIAEYKKRGFIHGVNHVPEGDGCCECEVIRGNNKTCDEIAKEIRSTK